jgi:hypothetical protein
VPMDYSNPTPSKATNSARARRPWINVLSYSGLRRPRLARTASIDDARALQTQPGCCFFVSIVAACGPNNSSNWTKLLSAVSKGTRVHGDQPLRH